jgi:predicted GNAT family acetyltransferase
VNTGDITIESGTRDDYARLSAWHYLAGPPATADRILRAVTHGMLAGVLVVSRPTLNGWWRHHVWPARYARRDKAAAARAVNRDLRTLSRVIVDPRLRACGIATALVRHYLAEPITRRTEAIAAMGAFCPFFARAGMREITAPPDQRGQALALWLADHGIGPLDLIDTGRAMRILRESGVESRLRAWCRGSIATHRLAEAEPAVLAAGVAHRAFAERRVYVAERD